MFVMEFELMQQKLVLGSMLYVWAYPDLPFQNEDVVFTPAASDLRL